MALDLVHPDDAVRLAHEVAPAVRGEGATWKGELRIRRTDGSWSTAEVSLRNLVNDPAVGGLVCTVHDVSARKAVEEELRRAKDAAEAASHAKGEFLATISHELRSPLHAIIGYADLLQEDAFGPRADEQASAVERIRKSAHGQLELVSALLDLSAMEANRLGIELVPVSVCTLLDELASEQRSAWGSLPLDVLWESDADLPDVLGDAAKLKIIVRNLVGNAVKFTERGSVRMAARRCGTDVELSVADTGIGIPADSLELIFEPFRQVDGSESRRYEGTGLGLHIVKRLLGLIGGSISVESDVGRGSVFRVRLPGAATAAAARAAEGEPGRVPEGAEARAGPDVAVALDPRPPGETQGDDRTAVPAPRLLQVLVVDDLAVNQQILTTVLRRLGTAVDVASTGREAVEAAARTRYDLILMDLQMPELDGLAATAEIRSCEPPGRRVPIVALTANTVAGTRERCLAAGMDDYLAKPVRPADLRAAIERWARQADASDSAAA
jgi:signal transduction histidine kinase/ActR/RegA family two-component response regulator